MRFITLILALLIPLAATPLAAQEVDVEAMLADRVLGDPSAPVTIIAYESLSCPHCAAFHRDNLGEVKERFVDTGLVKLIYRDFPLNVQAVRAAMLARCTDPRRFFGMLEVLFRSQADWMGAHDLDGTLARYGRLAGVGQDAFEACMGSEALFNGIVAMGQAATNEFAVNSTPTFVIDGVAYPGGRTADEFAAIIDPLLPSN